ncbi:MAG: hypothetical protein PHN57_08885 [Candidatus Omnitrophica bacterium]|nr:hypothetical protein [Candidatus Omnitrophota bacterium]
MNKGILSILTACFLLTGALGCASLSNRDSSSQSLRTQPLLKFSDLPVPVGFKILADESYSFESSGMRVGLLKYKGKATTAQLVNFYKEQMPMYNWSLLNITEYGECIMNFEREQESCIVNITPYGSSSVISLAMGPKSQALPKKTKKPIK